MRAISNRLRNIRAAQSELESALLTLQSHLKVPWTETDKSFKALYYIVNLARKAP